MFESNILKKKNNRALSFEGAKLPISHEYLNIATLFIPYYRFFAKTFYQWKIPHEWLTIGSILSGLIASILWFFQTSYVEVVFGALFFHVKDLLDATDGPVARMSNRSHPIWRYMDTLGDGLVVTVVMVVVGYWQWKNGGSLPLVFLGWISIFLQCSYWAYYQQRLMEKVNPSAMSMNFRTHFHPQQEEESCTSFRQLIWLRLLQKLYRLFFGWQDRGIYQIDRLVFNDRYGTLWFEHKLFLTLQSVLCFGTHIFIIWVCFLTSRVHWIGYIFAVFMNLYLCLLFIFRFLYFRVKQGVIYEIK